MEDKKLFFKGITHGRKEIFYFHNPPTSKGGLAPLSSAIVEAKRALPPSSQALINKHLSPTVEAVEAKTQNA
ncbi:MAG: hypothetical protein Q4D66_02025 [Bacteroidales bacterium]|nr:hypothetical protein [Bacteroidales bacterium]